jgi:hypothetical protein
MSRSCFVVPVIATVLFTLSFCSFDFLAAQDLADVIEKSERSVVRIEVKGRNGSSLGSGFVVESTGVIVTNVHVLAGAEEATATFANGEKYEIEGTYYFDESRDICIAQLDADNLPTIVVSKVPPRKGETVTALGAPRGLSFTATNGIVSAMRSGEQLGGDRNGTWIQIDAALSPGNSGGPLINKKGRVIAMSTLASTGNSQNLNFGISARDISEAIRESREYELTPLPEGVGELETDEDGGGGGEEAIISRPKISDKVIQDYVQECRDDYSVLYKRMLRDALEADKEFKLMRRGRVPFPRSHANSDAEVLVVGSTRNKKRDFYFRSERVKDRLVRQAEKKSTDLKKLKKTIAKTADDESIFELLKFTGPYVDPNYKRSIGVMDDAIVLHPFNDHDVIVLYDDKPFLVWMPSTSGLARGAELPPTTVYVSGTETVRVPGKSTMAVTVLIGLKESEIRTAIFGDKQLMAKKGQPIDGEMRTWTSGRYSIVAKVVRMSGEKITLEKVNGKTIDVTRDKLSDSDIEYLDGLAE